MDGERRRYELRSASRSRSRTPSVVSLISAEPDAIEYPYRSKSSAQESTRRSTSRSTSVGRTNDRRTGFTRDGTEISHTDTLRDKVETERSAAPRKVERRSERQRAKRQTFSNGGSEVKAKSLDAKSEKKGKSISPRRILTSDYSSEEGESGFPKADYTRTENDTSKSSPRSDGSSTLSCASMLNRRNFERPSEAMNDSCLGISVDTEESEQTERTGWNAQNCMFRDGICESPSRSHGRNAEAESRTRYTKTHVEQYQCHREIIYSKSGSSADFRQRNLSRFGTCIDSPKYGLASAVDSDAELEEAITISRKTFDGGWKVSRWISSLTATVLLWFSKSHEFLKLKTFRRREYRAAYKYERYHEPKWYTAWRRVDRSLQYFYLFMVSICFFDSWLLSRASGIRRWVQRRGLKLLWIVLLPLLLLTGYWSLPYVSTSSLSSIRVTSGQTREVFLSNGHVNYVGENDKEGGSMGSKDVKSIVETLSNRIEILEGRSIEETERLLNIARVLEKSKDKDLELWSIYNTKIMGLEERLEEGIANDTSFRQIEAMKLELEALKELSLRLKSCCKNRMEEFSDEHLEKRIETLLADYLGTTVSKQRLAKAVQSLMAADVERHPVTSFEKTTGRSDIVTVDLVHRIVKNTLKTYDADKTGLVDYALESAGGQIISTRCTQKYDINTRVFKILALTFYHENNNPRTVIQGNPIQPGACWAFQGFPGYLLIKLRSFIYVTGFTLEHAPKSILPNGEMGSAPRKFNAWGFTDENDPEPVLFGDYEFIASDDNLQYFPVQNATITTPYEYIELRVHSNHGQLDYTCLYRFRVHGKPV